MACAATSPCSQGYSDVAETAEHVGFLRETQADRYVRKLEIYFAYVPFCVANPLLIARCDARLATLRTLRRPAGAARLARTQHGRPHLVAPSSKAVQKQLCFSRVGYGHQEDRRPSIRPDRHTTFRFCSKMALDICKVTQIC
jgi:hypothetical protein